MYAGHFAAGLVLKVHQPRTPTWAIMLGVGLLDLLFGPFVLLGIERVSVTPGVSPGFSLDHIDWSHSLLMATVWSLAYAALFWRRGRSVAAVLGVAVFSHFVLDLVVHPGDLALWPGAATHLGFGLWRSLPRGWWLVELLVILAAGAWYLRAARSSSEFGGRPLAVLGLIIGLHLFNSPWLSPT